MRRGSVGLLVGLAVASMAIAGCSDLSSSPAAGTFKPRVPGVLTVVTSEIPSHGFWEGTPKHVTGGFEFELARRLAARFGLHRVRVELEPFDQIVAGHLNGADLALDLITPTSARAEHLSFSTPYLEAAPTVVARTGTEVPDLKSAIGLRWGAHSGTTFVDLINQVIQPNEPLTTYSSNAAMISALEAGKIDAVMFDLPFAVAVAGDSGGKLQAVAQLSTDETIAAALPKGSHNAQAVNSAVRAFTSDGTIDRLLRRWVGAAATSSGQSIPLLRTSQ